ncbi:B3 domain-containing protein [Senna tora]|uniref:B3 domain-containing protein n=1 Tax=Senna tora TaxID=362788 RepID=A0A834XHD6_9FABA|nr:B3 domain-containing protein [Senna tora]
MDAKPKKPSFFKVIINPDFSTRLQIPPAFVKKFGRQIPNKAKIETCDHGKLWEVEVQNLGGIFSFSKGWGNFVEETKVELGDFLTFKLLADSSKFKVKIYGKTCCEKELPYEHLHGGARRKNYESEKDKDFEEEDLIEIDSDSFDDKPGVLEQRRRKQRAKAEDEEVKFNSQYPFFQVKLTPSNIIGGYLYIPKHFRKHMKMMKKEQKVKFEICKEFSTMGLHFINEDGCNEETIKDIRICQGWRVFVKKARKSDWTITF